MTPASQTQRSFHSGRVGQNLSCADRTGARAAHSPPSQKLQELLPSSFFGLPFFLFPAWPPAALLPPQGRAHSAACLLAMPESSVPLHRQCLSLLPVRSSGKTC